MIIERRNPPRGWALPGGFVDSGETVEDAARREACEETGLTVHLKSLLGCYSDPGRDPRGPTASVVYIGESEGEPRAADDARHVAVYEPDRVPPLVFDHDTILADYRVFRQTGRPAPVR